MVSSCGEAPSGEKKQGSEIGLLETTLTEDVTS